MSRDRVENREYMREYRAALRADVPEVEPRDPTEGAVYQATLAELGSLPAAKLMCSAAAAALALASVLDDPDATPQKAAVAGQLRQTMAEIRSARAPSAVSKLSMIRGGRAAG